MRRREFMKVAGTTAVAGVVSPTVAAGAAREDTVSRLRSLEPRPVSPFHVGAKAQLFVDRVLVREAQGVGFTLHRAEKHPSNPVVRADRPWEGWRLEIYGNVIADWLKNARLLHAQKDIECIFPDSHVRPSDAVARNWTCRH